MFNALGEDGVTELGILFEQLFLLDTKHVIAARYRGDKRHSDIWSFSDNSYSSTRRLKYIGSKLVMLTTLDGTPYALELVPANSDEYTAPDEVPDTPTARQ